MLETFRDCGMSDGAMPSARNLSFWLAGVLCAALSGCMSMSPSSGAEPLFLRDTAGASIEPLAVGTNRVVIFLFISTDCPISNAYAPEVNRIAAQYGRRGVAIRLVHADADVTPEIARKHLADYRYTMTAVLDPAQKLAGRLGAKITPEAFVVAADGRTVYRGRIDDMFPALGKRRPEPTERDLRNALDAFLEGRPVAKPVTQAVGCYLPTPKAS
jgi:thiol-disulfide isomerase/thioredoxin